MKFPYLKLPSTVPGIKWIARPYIQVKLTGPRGSSVGYALIDSGADRSLFNIQIAEKIGLDLSKATDEYFGGIEGGNLKAKLHKVKLEIIGMDEEIEILAGFIDSSGVAAILGQDGFFDTYKIKFEKDHGVIEITPVKKFTG